MQKPWVRLAGCNPVSVTLAVRWLVALLGALLLTTLAQAQDPSAGRGHGREFRPGQLQKIDELPLSRLRTRLERLPAGAKTNALKQLRDFHFTEQDVESLEVDDEGAVFYADHFRHEPNHTELENAGETEPTTGGAAVPVAPFPAGLAFHSKPGAPNVLFLNFAGENVTNTAWNTSLGRTSLPTLPFSTDNDFSTYSDSEQLAIKRIWQRVAEDFAPFNIDVTTERPTVFDTRTAHALITRNTDANGAGNPSSTAGGVAYINMFGTANFARYRPAWVYANNLSGSESSIAEAVSHEIGHNLGLSHDGKTDGAEYYGGHGTGETSWGPLMGTGYGRNVSQWSRGEYYLANNTQDDLAAIAAKVGYRSDDHSDAVGSATVLTMTGTNIVSTTPETDVNNMNTANKGVLERNTDTDVFSFQTGSGTVRLTVNPWRSPTSTRGGDLDLLIELRDGAGNLIASDNPATATAAQIQAALAQGTYFLFVRNSGTGSPLTAAPTGYTSYGSIGQYFISGYVAPSSAAAGSVQLTTTANNSAWGSVTPANGLFPIGSAVQLTAMPANYFRFVRWTNGVNSTSNPLSLTMQTNITVQAVFGEVLTVNRSIPHWWLASNGYAGNFEAAVDAIGANGLPVWQSYIAGLTPTAPTSQLKLSVTRNSNGTSLLKWLPVSGRTYSLSWSTNVSGPFTAISSATNLAATVSSFTHTSSAARAFYRVEVRKL